MNGVRRFLNVGLPSPPPPPPPPPAATISPLVISGKPSWPPSSPTLIARELSESPTPTSPKSSTPVAALLLRRDKPRPPLPQSDNSSSRSNSTPTALGSSPPRSQSSTQPSSSYNSPHEVTELSLAVAKYNGNNDEQPDLLNTRDELLISLLASETVVECRGYGILSSEQIEELKKEHQVLTSRVVAMRKKLTLETKIRDAAVSLSRVNSPYNKSVVKQTSEQLETANHKVELAQRELWKVSERANDINRQLLEHRAGVLSYAIRNMESKSAAGTSDANASSYPNSQIHRNGPTHSKFEHFFAGHADTIVPLVPRKPLSAGEVAEIEGQLQVTTQNLNAAHKKQAEMARDLSLLKLEKEQIQTSMEMELQTTSETINTLEQEVSNMDSLRAQLRNLQEERRSWEQDRIELRSRRKDVETLESRLELLEERSAETTEIKRLLEQSGVEIAQSRQQWQAEKTRLEAETKQLLKERDDVIAQSRQQWQAERTRLEAEKSSAKAEVQQVQTVLDEVYGALRTFTQRFGIVSPSQSSSSSFSESLESVTSHFEHLTETKTNLEQRLEEAQVDQDQFRKEIRFFEAQAKEQSDRIAELIALQSTTTVVPVEYTGSAEKIVAALMPIWITLPSVEARGAKLGQNRFKSSSSSPDPMKASLSELDVRALKTLYDSNKLGQIQSTSAAFTIEVFVSRVQALINDDRALVERLMRFAQAHDMLKKNAERAHKLALDSNSALETYQRQVKTLESRNIALTEKHASLLDMIQNLEETAGRLESEKREIEMQAAEQAETCRQLTDANNALSAKTLGLAEEAASATATVRRHKDAQLTECKAALQKARDEVEAMQNLEQTQRIALLEELNSMQTENSNLRNQLRILQVKK